MPKIFDLIKIVTDKDGNLQIQYSSNFLLSMSHSKDLEEFKKTLIYFFSSEMNKIVTSSIKTGN